MFWRTMLSIALTLVMESAAAELDWEITNRFRAFDYLGNQDQAAEIYSQNVPKPNENDFIAWHKRVVAAKGSPPYSPFADRQGPWDEKTATYDKKFVDLPETIQIRIFFNKNNINQITGPCQLDVGGQTILAPDCLKTPATIAVPSSGSKATLSANGIVIAAVAIRPRLKVILGLGDSYGAGEGAPDRPVEWEPDVMETSWPLEEPERVGGWVKHPANWLSNRCNRSFFSAQSITALALSRDDPHSVVSFVHLSCTGAEVIDGLLAEQRMPPGHDPKCKPFKDRKDKLRPISSCDVKSSQLQNAVNLLCSDSTRPVSRDILEEIKKPLAKLKVNAYQQEWVSKNTLTECSKEKLRVPDLVLISVGGNDIGFAGVIAWGLTPITSRFPVLGDWLVGVARGKAGVVCPDSRSGHCAKKEPPATERIHELSHRYAAMEVAFRRLLRAEGKSIVLPTYSNPLTNAAGDLCGDKPRENAPRNAWGPTRMRIPASASPDAWQINLTQDEAKHVKKYVISGLNNAVTSTYEKYGWTVPDVGRVMEKRGWCTGKTEGKLTPPNKLHRWDVHRDDTRMIQTSADSASTQWASKDRDDWLAGTFHPNVWGYAGLATEIYRSVSSQGLPTQGEAQKTSWSE